jgi:2-polyprenyl-3-methyl-5-hydroxy-6-metoxy-1,4-benzoquinol methylase
MRESLTTIKPNEVTLAGGSSNPAWPLQDTQHSIVDFAGKRWPVLDGIPFMRQGRESLAATVLARLDVGQYETALALLLADQDDWWEGPRANLEALTDLVRRRDDLTLRQAMARLQWGPVADYFAHRGSDPTFLAGLALSEAHWTAPRHAFELACGIGHYLRVLDQHGVIVTGTDIVFAKLWVARHWVVPNARLICMDAAAPLIFATLGEYDLVTCHDSFYFLEPKAAIVERLRELRNPDRGVLLVGHVHNRDWPNFSSGNALTATEMMAMFPAAELYDDAELTRALVGCRSPRAVTCPETLQTAEAFAAAEGPGLLPARAVQVGLALPLPNAMLRRNPLYGANGHISWPSERYEKEYSSRATYPTRTDTPSEVTMAPVWAEAARRRELLDLPDRW